MAGSVENMAAIYKKKTFAYIPPTPPAELIDSTTYTLHFTGRKFLNIGIDPTDMFNVAVHIITPSRHVNITPDFLKRIFSLMGNILSFILDQPQKYKRILFLETEYYKLSSMVYGGENMLVIQSKTQDGCRVLLSRADIIQLQYLEWCIFETIERKSTITKSIILNQFYLFGNYIEAECIKGSSPPKTNDEMVIFIKNLTDEHIIANTVKDGVNFISQLKMQAATQLAEQWVHRHIGDIPSELFVESKVMSPLSPPTPMSPPIPMSPPTPMSPPPASPNSIIQIPDAPRKAVDENDGPLFRKTRSLSETGDYDSALSEMYFVKRKLF